MQRIAGAFYGRAGVYQEALTAADPADAERVDIRVSPQRDPAAARFCESVEAGGPLGPELPA